MGAGLAGRTRRITKLTPCQASRGAYAQGPSTNTLGGLGKYQQKCRGPSKTYSDR